MLTINSWSDTAIPATVPTLSDACRTARFSRTAQPTAQCGELVITRGDNGKHSIDAITVTVGGSAPWVVTETGVTAPAGKSVKDYAANFGRMNLALGATNQSPIQAAIDSASPGDLILVDPGTYRENLIMWKPVRLQGVGAASVTINADAHPAGQDGPVAPAGELRLRPDARWRSQHGQRSTANSTRAGIVHLSERDVPQRVDRIPFEAIIGWDASGNGNLAQVLQEPTLMGAYEGAGITVLGRGVRDTGAAATDFWGQRSDRRAGAFPDGSVYLTAGSQRLRTSTRALTDGRDYGTSNYLLQPVAHRRPVDHQQLAGRRRRVHARLGAQPRDRQQPHLRQPRHAGRRHQPRQRRDAADASSTTARSAAPA